MIVAPVRPLDYCRVAPSIASLSFPVAQRQRDEQKLWLILFQLKGIRSRINSLAAQYFAFSALAIIIAGAAIVLAAALVLRPLSFLFTAIIVAIAAFISVIRVTRTALHS